jgi:PEP-CTERM motif
MKAPFVTLVALVAVAFTGVARASSGPTFTIYLTYSEVGNDSNIVSVLGNTITMFPEAYGSPNEIPIAVSGDIRTTGFYSTSPNLGGQYTLAGVPTGQTYTLPPPVIDAYDSTTDSHHNYLVDYTTGTVYQTDRDFTNPVPLFNVGPGNLGITYEVKNNSLWISGWYANTFVTDYSLSGGFISSFSTGHYYNGALAIDPTDQNLWLVDDANTYALQEYSTAGQWMGSGPAVGYTLGGEENIGYFPSPEPGTLMMFGSGIVGLAGLVRRKIKL